jgi:hypothetical protein
VRVNAQVVAQMGWPLPPHKALRSRPRTRPRGVMECWSTGVVECWSTAPSPNCTRLAGRMLKGRESAVSSLGMSRASRGSPFSNLVLVQGISLQTVNPGLNPGLSSLARFRAQTNTPILRYSNTPCSATPCCVSQLPIHHIGVGVTGDGMKECLR